MLDCTALTFCIFHFFKTPSTVKHGERCRLSNVPIQDQFSLQHFSPLYFYSLFHTTFSTHLASQDSRQPSSCSPLFSVFSRILLSPSQDPNSQHAKHSLLSAEWIQQPYGKVNPLLGWFPSSILGGCPLFSKDCILLNEHF